MNLFLYLKAGPVPKVLSADHSWHRFLPILLGVAFLFLFSSCSHLRNGRYIQLRPGENLDSIAEKYGVPQAALTNENPSRQWRAGEWVFVPREVGFLHKLMGESQIYGQGYYSKEEFNRGKFLWPVPASHKVSSAFGTRRGRKTHAGIDIPASRGVNIVSVDDGIVEYAGHDAGGYGNMIIVRHKNNFKTLYAHAKEKLTTKDSKVFRGQIIGLVGSTGHSSGPHLHFEVIKDGSKIDPFPFFFN
jgi:murein DD-endopeptidase MepM/ murein hydrolase activator NlpD